MTLLRLERRYFGKKYAEALLSADICNSLGLDEVLHAIAPCAGLSQYVVDPATRKAQVPCARSRVREPLSPLACCVCAAAPCPSQIYTADVDEYLNALAHMVRSVKHLTQGWGTRNVLPAWVRRIFRDLLAALMLAPSKFREGMRPTRSAYTKDVWDPRDRTQKIAVTIMHKDQWWSRPPHEWARRVHDYIDPALILARELAQQSGATRAADGGTGEDADGEAATAQRTHAASMRRRHDEARAAVRPPLHPCAPCACGIGVSEPGGGDRVRCRA